MQRIKGIVVGFVAGVACATGAVLLMRDSGGGPAQLNSLQLAEINEQVRRLEQSVSRLTNLVAASPGGAVAAPQSPQTMPGTAAPARTPEQVQAVAAADALVDRGIQSGQWTRDQADELYEALAAVDSKEGARILARISAAINRDELRIQVP